MESEHASRRGDLDLMLNVCPARVAWLVSMLNLKCSSRP